MTIAGLRAASGSQSPPPAQSPPSIGINSTIAGIATVLQSTAERRENRSLSRNARPHVPSPTQIPDRVLEAVSNAGSEEEGSSVPLHYDGDPRECTLCQAEFVEHQRVCRLPCRHVFHSTCYEQLLSHHRAGEARQAPYPPCPNCRGNGRVIATWVYVPEVDITTPRDATPVTPRVGITMSEEIFSTPQQEAGAANHSYAWMPSELSFLSSAEQPMGLLVDPGSWGNLAGDQWIAEASRRAEIYDQHTKWEQRATALRVGGVGKTTDEVHHNASVPVAIVDADGQPERGVYKTPVLRDSSCPALLGLQSLTQLGAVLDLRNKVMHLCGEDDATIRLPAGAKSYPLFQAQSGHLLLRVDHHENAAKANEAGAGRVTQRHLLADHLEPPPSPMHERIRKSRTSQGEAMGPSDEDAVAMITTFRRAPSLRSRCCHARCTAVTKLKGCTRP
eukprot:6491071-Amphidinium_carterae.1